MKFLHKILFIMLISTTVFAQGLVNFNYQMTYPTGETSDYIDKISFRGIGVEWRRFVDNNISAGISMNWNVFNQVATETAEIEDGHVTGTQNRTINSFPLLATAHYYLGDRKNMHFYGGLGIGAFLIKQRLGIGIYAFEETNWHFGVAPEIGVQIPIAYETLLLLAAKYNYAFEVNGMKHSYLGLHVGIATEVF